MSERVSAPLRGTPANVAARREQIKNCCDAFGRQSPFVARHCAASRVLTSFRQAATPSRLMRRRASRRRTEPPEDDGPSALTAAELAERFVAALLDHAREVEVDAGDAAAMAALDLICRLAVYGRAPLAAVLDTLAKAAPVRVKLLKDANKRNQPPPLGVGRLGPLVLSRRRIVY